MAFFDASLVPRIEGDVFTQKYPPLSPNGAALLATTCVMLVLTTAWTAMRAISCRLRVLRFQVEDYLYFIGFVFFCGLAMSFILIVCVAGAGNDSWRLTPGQVLHFQRLSIANQCLYAATLFFIKLSIMSMVKRVFGAAGRRVQIATYVTMGVVIIWTLYALALAFFLCLPVGASWGAVEKTSCIDYTTAYSTLAGIDIVSEVMIVAIPLKLLGSLQIAKAHRLAIYSVFCAGFVTIVCSCLRLYFVFTITNTTGRANPIRAFAIAALSSILQVGISVIVASSPMLRPVYDRTILRWLGISTRQRTRNTTPNGNGLRSTASVGKRSSVSHRGPSGFRQISESEEHLAWEMGEIDIKAAGGGQTTSVMAMTNSDDTRDSQSSLRRPSDNQILVMRETTVER